MMGQQPWWHDLPELDEPEEEPGYLDALTARNRALAARLASSEDRDDPVVVDHEALEAWYEGQAREYDVAGVSGE